MHANNAQLYRDLNHFFSILPGKTDGKATGDPYNTWYFMTKNGGKLDCSDADYLANGDYILNDGTVIISDELYKDAAGGVIFPVGTYEYPAIGHLVGLGGSIRGDGKKLLTMAGY